MTLSRYSMGVGDRFARQGRAQLAAFVAARERGVEITPVWNKSHREHAIVGSHPRGVRAEADDAVRALGWTGPYWVDADHVSAGNVDAFIESCDFFTIDMADFVGRPAPEADIQEFVARHRRYVNSLRVPGIDRPLAVTKQSIACVARNYLTAVREAGEVYRRIRAVKGHQRFIAEVSLDETASPQTPEELLCILAALAEERIPARTVAPKFTGRFNKGVDYAGDTGAFERGFNEVLAVIAYAVQEFDLPSDLKLSVHSGSDKFSIYGAIARALRRHRAGLHLKTAGTTWLEELAGLAAAGGASLELAKTIYEQAHGRIDELCRPYLAVIDIDPGRLPSPDAVRKWSGEEYASALRHNQACPAYNPHFRQMLHVAFRVAAEMGDDYLRALDASAGVIGPMVTENLFARHIEPLFLRV